MKKLILIICGIMMIGSSYAVTLCKKNNTAIAVLNKVVGGSLTTSGLTWSVAMTDGNTVHGKALCTAMPGSGFGVVNTGVADTTDTGVNCFCKMMGPATSYWVFANEYADATACDSGCASVCGNYMAGTATGCAAIVTMEDEATDMCLKFRSAVYDSIW